jgi:hypothetical protein
VAGDPRLAREGRHRRGEGVVISVDAERIFAYAQALEQAQEAAGTLGELAQDHHLTAHATITQWDPEHEQWETADAPPPETSRIIAGRRRGPRRWGGNRRGPRALPCAGQSYRPSTAGYAIVGVNVRHGHTASR